MGKEGREEEVIKLLILVLSPLVGHVSEGPPRTILFLTIVEANNIAYSANVTTKNHYCSIELGGLTCRTPPVKAKCWPTWNFKVRIARK